jgi:ABC-type transport system involved in cytochrome bd biosynthesis fused ATPase/permease subunit
MTDLRQGTITVDGVGIAGLAGSDVCTEINVVPQEPFFMPGTVRFNLDPQGRGSDEAIETAIRRAGLWGVDSERSWGVGRGIGCAGVVAGLDAASGSGERAACAE